jgi:hypothetical protein
MGAPGVELLLHELQALPQLIAFESDAINVVLEGELVPSQPIHYRTEIFNLLIPRAGTSRGGARTGGCFPQLLN